MSCELTEEWRRRLEGPGRQEELRARQMGVGEGLSEDPRDEVGRLMLELEAADASVLAICSELSECRRCFRFGTVRKEPDSDGGARLLGDCFVTFPDMTRAFASQSESSQERRRTGKGRRASADPRPSPESGEVRAGLLGSELETRAEEAPVAESRRRMQRQEEQEGKAREGIECNIVQSANHAAAAEATRALLLQRVSRRPVAAPTRSFPSFPWLRHTRTVTQALAAGGPAFLLAIATERERGEPATDERL